ncbi:hypothetical protein PGT21_007435 [Puccinia graminis f. sp. tritici]|uniref:Uncharacterized protein n=1 Tax=Puccinia graminis f. sp. tritici TaxID=56615 RepID=A0A5B0MJS9_PUCGR|nr:hypothetical protein PGT21_007856 [Puccinia graminis f. sp. tritici]KAA1077155.1 hypothetical protein PGTUg99_006456 [Puccinia graminis f. sp. tritici]KAA1104017.1 hypothetical protein PGT21_007435 [Puccinia graminis f. sp. tritici]
MADPAQEIFQFILNLPQSVNPYEAVAVQIKELTQVPKPPLWGRIVRRVLAFQFFILCVQCITVLWLRKKAKKLKFFRFNKLGLIHIEVLNEIVFFMLLFSIHVLLDQSRPLI